MNQPKAILLANIGTSDLAVQILINEKEYYLPIDFLPNEPNLKKQVDELPSDLKEIWEKQREHIQTTFYQKLGLPVGAKITSRKLTQVLLGKYKKNPSHWHPLLKPVRIWGTIIKSINLGANEAYIFVTNQRTSKKPDGEEKDTIYLYYILRKWLKEENLEFKIKPKLIPADVIGNELEPMLEYYYQSIKKITENRKNNQFLLNDLLALVSIKGGTPAMQTSLQIQAIDSAFSKIAFVDPQLSIIRILQGEPSDCKLTLYWHHIRNQKYQTAKKLLEVRWDFDGARTIFKDWKKTIRFFIEELQIADLNSEEEKSEQVITILDFAIDCFNLDKKTTIAGNKIKRWLNLYTQCRIYWQLDEIANFLTRLGSFYEEILQELIRQLDGEKYLKDGNKDNQWIVINPENKFSKQDSNKKPVLREHQQERYGLWNELVKLEQKMGGYEVTWKSLRSNEIFLKIQGIFKTDDDQALKELNNILLLKNICYRNNYKLTSRYSKRNFVQALINVKHQDKEDSWNQVFSSLEKLDYWCAKRNDLIHSAKGMSEITMKKELEEDRQNWTEEDEKDKYKANPHKACEVHNIQGEMTNICQYVNRILNQESEADSKYIGYPENTPYYIYSNVLEKIFQQLS